MELIERKQSRLIRQQKKAGLVDYEFVKGYIDSFGRPNCYCCKIQISLFIPARLKDSIRFYCINCALTIQCCGVCQHGSTDYIFLPARRSVISYR